MHLQYPETIPSPPLALCVETVFHGSWFLVPKQLGAAVTKGSWQTYPAFNTLVSATSLSFVLEGDTVFILLGCSLYRHPCKDSLGQMLSQDV